LSHEFLLVIFLLFSRCVVFRVVFGTLLMLNQILQALCTLQAQFGD
jgi:hypothetical protein